MLEKDSPRRPWFWYERQVATVGVPREATNSVVRPTKRGMLADSVGVRLRPLPMGLPKPLHPVVDVDGPFVVTNDILTALDDSELLRAHVTAGGPLTMATREQAAGARRAAAGRGDLLGGPAARHGEDA
jgi:hypothetical protein